jgi:hypothetical protein
VSEEVVAKAKRTKSPPVEKGDATVRRSKSVVRRKDGRELRRTTIYLPTDLARQLAVYCAERDSEMSDVIAAAVRGWISRDR